MTKNFCDRCQQEIKRPFKKYLMINRVYYRGSLGFGPEKEEIIFKELCKDCQESLEHWWLRKDDEDV